MNHPGAFSYFAPKLWAKYAEVMEAITNNDPSLEWSFKNSIFPAATINFGPESVCFEHLDDGNYGPGMCPITSLGPFDYTKGGHLILFDIKRVIEFPSGSLILIPSAVMRHGNTTIQEGETRMGFTQYGSGAIFRYAEAGCRRLRNMDPATKARMDAEAPHRYENLLKLYSKVDELADDRKNVFQK